MTIDLPEKLHFLFEPHRTKGAYGGRGSAKSWGVARALLTLARSTRKRILCGREIQKSIKESVHRLLSDQIQLLGMGSFFTILDQEIRGRNGSQFVYTGLQDHTVDSIKSYEAVDIAWIEEAQTVTKKSWDILIPTIRAPGSEIWITFNPAMDTDETWKRFIVNPPQDCVMVQLNWRDNPWFPAVLDQERRHCQVTDPENYANIWEGEPRTVAEGAIYARELAACYREQRVTLCPYDPRLRVHTVWDLGYNNNLSIGFVQRERSSIRLIDHLSGGEHDIPSAAAALSAKHYNYGYDWIPHDGWNPSVQTGQVTVADMLRRAGRKPRPVPNQSVESGILALRAKFAQIVFHKPTTARIVESLKRYARHIPRHGEPSTPIHNEWSHDADMMRYVALCADQMTNVHDELSPRVMAPYRIADPGLGAFG